MQHEFVTGAHLDADPTVRFLRAAILWLVLLGVGGIEVELLLLKHVDGAWQLLPVVLLGVALLVSTWHLASRSGPSLRAFQGIMAVFVAVGVAGVLLHYRGNVEWELERLPGVAGFELFRMAIMGATPTLAPGVMLQLGLLGLLYSFRHPSLRRSTTTSEQP